MNTTCPLDPKPLSKQYRPAWKIVRKPCHWYDYSSITRFSLAGKTVSHGLPAKKAAPDPPLRGKAPNSEQWVDRSSRASKKFHSGPGEAFRMNTKKKKPGTPGLHSLPYRSMSPGIARLTLRLPQKKDQHSRSKWAFLSRKAHHQTNLFTCF